MASWPRTTKQQPCPICSFGSEGRFGHCTFAGVYGQGAHWCNYTGGVAPPGWVCIAGPANWVPDDPAIRDADRKPTKQGYVFVPSDRRADQRPSREQIEANDRERIEEAQQKRAAALELWRTAEKNNLAALKYFHDRGIPLAELPASVRYIARGRPNETSRPDGTPFDETPMVVCGIAGPDGVLWGVQCIRLTADGHKLAGKFAKITAGPFSGGAVRMGMDLVDHTLILAEGPETALAVQHATGVPAWAALSWGGIVAFELPREIVESGQVRRVVIAADLDGPDKNGRDNPSMGNVNVKAACLRADHPGLVVEVRRPTHDVAPSLVPASNTLLNKQSVDWLDVLNAEAAPAVRAGVMDGLPDVPSEPASVGLSSAGGTSGGSGEGGSSTGRAGGDGGRNEPDIITANVLGRARRCQRELFTPGRGNGNERGYTLRRWNERWWRYDEITGGVWHPLTDEGLGTIVAPWLESKYKPGKTDDHPPVSINPSDQAVNHVVSRLKTHLLLEDSGGKIEPPVWIEPDVNKDGWNTAPKRKAWRRTVPRGEHAARGRPDPSMLLAFPDCLFDLEAWMTRREVKQLPHDECYFNHARIPYTVPLDELAACKSDADIDGLIDRVGPHSTEFVKGISQGDNVFQMQLMQMIGLSLVPARIAEIIGYFIGLSGSGKGTAVTSWMEMLGPEYVINGDLELFTTQFFSGNLVGRSLLIFDDVDVGRKSDPTLVSNRLKALTGGPGIYADEKHSRAKPNIRPYCEVCITANRLLNLPDPGGGLLRRTRVLVFPDPEPGQPRDDSSYKARVVAERAAWMLRAIFGLRLFHEGDRTVEQHARGLDLINEQRVQVAPAESFADECLHVTELDDQEEPAWVSTEDMYTVFEWWCKASAKLAHVPAKGAFIQQLRPAIGFTKHDRRQRDRVWGYAGIAIDQEIYVQVVSKETPYSLYHQPSCITRPPPTPPNRETS